MEILAAFVVGLVGSFHCIGMCGPIAMALPIGKKNRILSILTYNIGRTLTYAVLGFLFGLIGKGFAMAGFQQIISIISGALIIVSVIAPAAILKNTSSNYGIFNKLASVKKKMGSLFQNSSYSSLFSIGLLNGILPCGLVYMAILGALATGSPAKGSLFMALFGLGTIPVMAILPLLKTFVSNNIRVKINKFVPAFILLMGVAILLRGLNLGIPYLSPKINFANSEVNCCH